MPSLKSLVELVVSLVESVAASSTCQQKGSCLSGFGGDQIHGPTEQAVKAVFAVRENWVELSGGDLAEFSVREGSEIVP